MTLDRVQISHGSGGGLNDLLRSVILPALMGSQIGPLEDAAVLPVCTERLAFTTDSFVVSPLEFPGGDIGKLAACGTINDLAMMGAKPHYLSVALILEEGLDVTVLRRVLNSLRIVCEENKVKICCGDTKVVERGKADGLFITTSGIGSVPSGRSISAAQAHVDDVVIVSGAIGLHGIAILAQRKNLGFASEAISDCTALSDCVETLLAAVPSTHVLRDATRGGFAAILNEIAQSSGVTIHLQESNIPIPDLVASACSFLGLDPLQIANEGRFVAIVPPQDADRAVAVLRSHADGSGACIIGRVDVFKRFGVVIETEMGGLRPVEVPPGRLLPRIC